MGKEATMKELKHTRERAARRPSMTMLEMRIDARRWEQVRATCRRLSGREVSDTDCLMMVTEHYLMKLGLHTR
jgi:hypothetical protein